jgi:hypothetical protein
MTSKTCALLVFLAFAAPLTSRAEIIINEIAWMGTDEGGANCEWIEFRNLSDEVVDLSAWTLVIKNAGSATEKVIALNEAASVKYSGVNANGYYLVARDSGSCKDLAPAEDADWIGSFGNGIGNSGALITLRNAGTEEDEVDATAGWETAKGGPGGKNASPKETPQRTGAGWITAAPTPRGLNHVLPLEEIEEPEDDDASPVVTVGGTAPLVPVVHPVPDLYVEGGPARVVLAGADTVFSGIAYDSTGDVRKSARLTWSFGDGGHAKGDMVTHAYRKPGSYTAVVRARSDGLSAVALIPVVVEAPALSVELIDGGVTITNSDDTLADLSGWKIDMGKRSVRLPADTVIAAGASVTFLPETFNVEVVTDSKLLFPNGLVAAQPRGFVAGTSTVQEVEPGAPLTKASSHAEYAVNVPAAAPQTPAAGTAVHATTEPGKVILKDGRGFFSSLASTLFTFFQ